MDPRVDTISDPVSPEAGPGPGQPPDVLAPPTPADPDLSVGKVVARSFSIWWRNILVFSTVALAVNSPVIALAFAGIRQRAPGSNPFAPLLVNLLEMGLSLIAAGALTAGVFQSLRGERLGVGRMLGIGLRKALPLFGLSLILGILVGCGTVLLIVPGLIALAGCYLAVPALVAEDLGVTAAVSRSWELSRGRRGRILLTSLIFMLGAAGVSIGCAVLLGGFPAGIVGRMGNEASGIVQIVAVLVGVVGDVAPVVAYHDLRLAKEGVSTAELAAVFE